MRISDWSSDVCSSDLLTEYVLSTGEPLLADRATIADLEAAGTVRSFGPLANCWLGVPLKRDDTVIGGIVVQSYTPEIGFGSRDQELLTFVAPTSTAHWRASARKSTSRPRTPSSSSASRRGRASWKAPTASCARRSASACARSRNSPTRTATTA